MKFLLLTLVLILCQNEKVDCNFLNFMAARFTDLAYTFTSTVDSLRLHVQNLLTPKPTPVLVSSTLLRRAGKPTKKTVIINKTEQYFNNYDEDERVLDPLGHMSTPLLVSTHGREVESHVITTMDGYVLTVHRILPKENFTTNISNQTIILHHGLLGSSADWLLQGPINSLPYLLTDDGYDVWLANARGNYYSRGHVYKKVVSVEFWSFSFQEIGEFDLAAVIDYIRKLKKFNETTDKIDFIGHSMGSTALLVLLSTLPSYNQYLRIGILLAPLAYMANSEGPLRALMSMSSDPPEQLLKVIGTKEFLPSRRVPKWIAMKYCKGPIMFCCNPLYFMSGGIDSAATWHKSFIEKIMYHVPAGASTATIMHYAQLVMNGKFHKYNAANNEFALNQITLPIALISSDSDWLATVPDVLRLYFSIANPIDHYIIRGKNFSHTEFIWTPDIKSVVYHKIFEYLNNESNWVSLKSNEVTKDGL